MGQYVLRLEKNRAHEALVGEYPEYFSFSEGRPVAAEAWDGDGFEVHANGEGVNIRYRAKSDYFKALGACICGPERAYLRMEPPFEFRGLMIDVSRNGVLRPDYLRKIMAQLALMGINYLALYTEDTYEVSGHPLIGYKRGAYSKSELKGLAEHAEELGIEMFPCVQTLGHLSQVLKFEQYSPVRDTDDVLSPKTLATYRLVEALIESAAEPYQSKLIHIGMDETWGLGTGWAMEINSKQDPRLLYLQHLANVAETCRKLGLSPIIWGDIIIGMHGTPPMTRQQTRMIPREVTINFWNYYLKTKEVYAKIIKNYRGMGFEPIVSPGMWNWNRLWGLYPKVERTATPMMEAARELGIKRAMMTMWGDDGQEAPWRSNLPGLALYAEHCWGGDASVEGAKRVVEKLGGDTWESFVLPSRMDYFDGASSAAPNMAKCFLYDDPLLRIYSSHAGQASFKRYYEGIRKQLRAVAGEANPRNRTLFEYAYALADCLSAKADLGNQAYWAYRAGDRQALERVRRSIPLVTRKMTAAWQKHRSIWLEENKPFGLEVLDARYGGCLLRLRVMEERLSRYLKGETDVIEEYEEQDQEVYGPISEINLGYRQTASITMVR